ncbi:MAG: aminodeoxychorismate/anthranilate synthase component II [Dictyoglomus thermophilum]|uniref:Aminodeoxychorismate/anthranilate synthase component II n=2 Tax=Pseudomonadati TaxID=3379134 RepID=A0A7C4NSU4_9BACT|nr:aminodeoxychorismate/anthranilate synthase component II [Dictyoglomus thermophilum]MCX7720894.1 aminodeoxychorismate/anthranilate synthase component II [Dictyoglomus thermophilum]TYT20950.1 aminodeoxychorismate/anthranilate synthase component II [Dictyoglomus thermophilum]
MLLIVDNFDSFTYNLYNYFQRLKIKTLVKNRDEINISYISKLNPDYIVLSPGPGRPTDDHILLEIIDVFKNTKKILGVCLGHQAIGVYFGLKLVKAQKPMHGMIDEIIHDEKGVFKNIKNPLKVVRYHSLVLEKDKEGDNIEITAYTKNKEIMGIRHKFYKIEGVQFHPESIGTEDGIRLLKNFLEI